MRTLILHNIRSTHNVGAIFRTAEGFGVDHIIITGYTPYPATDNDPRLPHIAQKLTKQIHKTALGAESMVSFEYHPNIDDVLKKLKATNTPLLALEQHPTSTSLKHYHAPHTWALLLGEEVYGITSELIAKCDTILEIPMEGKKESFNVSVATGIALYQLTQLSY